VALGTISPYTGPVFGLGPCDTGPVYGMVPLKIEHIAQKYVGVIML
jgi:hypothetical protein